MVEVGAKISHRKRRTCYETLHKSSDLDGFLFGTTRAAKNGICNVRSPYSLGYLNTVSRVSARCKLDFVNVHEVRQGGGVIEQLNVLLWKWEHLLSLRDRLFRI